MHRFSIATRCKLTLIMQGFACILIEGFCLLVFVMLTATAFEALIYEVDKG